MLQTLRRAGGSLVMTVPKVFIEQNSLVEGSQVELHLEVDILPTLSAVRLAAYAGRTGIPTAL